MTQTLAIFLEAYRNLNSKKLFWITLAISAFVVLPFALMSLNPHGFKILFWQFDDGWLNTVNIRPAMFYKVVFSLIGVKWWLSVGAIILALVSTAGVFPDLVSSGSIDLYVARPISRLRLFLTQYLAGMLFVTLQVALFILAAFLVVGFRGGIWEPGLFVAVPLVLCLFSYLFSVCVLLGVLTRSTVAALMWTLLFWLVLFGLSFADDTVLYVKTMKHHGLNPWNPQTQSEHGPGRLASEAKPASPSAPPTSGWDVTHRIIYGVRTVLPKTADTVDLLDKSLARMADIPTPPKSNADDRLMAAGEDMVKEINARSVGWIVGTSLLFEFVALAWAATVFCRRDF